MMFKILFIVLMLFIAQPSLAKTSLPARCEVFVNSLPEGFSWDFIKVPENHKKPAGRKIAIFYYYSEGALKAKAPSFFINGGPVESSHDSFRAIMQNSEAKKVPWIVFDQRGTGCSSEYPKVEDGLDRLAHWGAYSIAQDAEFLRKKILGDKKWQVVGHSYGGLISFWLMTLFPNSVQSAHIYGFAFTDDPVEWVVNRFSYTKVQQDKYFEDRPEKISILKKFTNSIEEDECAFYYDIKICGKGFVDQMGLYLLSPDQWGRIDHYIDRMNQSFGMSPNFREKSREKILLDLARISFKLLSQDKIEYRIFLSNLDIVPGWTSKKVYTEAYSRMKQRGMTVDNWLINEYRGLMALKDPNPEIKPNKIDHQLSLAALSASTRKNKQLKVHLYSGENDGVVPPSTYNEVRDILKDKAIYHELPDKDHNGFFEADALYKKLQ